jgi:glycosyltransferase involved in cell wall biosynthesis
MHVLWLIPAYYSFLVEELVALAPLVGRCSVISPAEAQPIAGVTTASIPADVLTPRRIAGRAVNLARTASHSPLPTSATDLRKLRRLARLNEFITDFVRREQVDVVHSHFAMPEGSGGWQAAAGAPVVLTLRGVDILTVPDHGYGFMLSRFYRRSLAIALRSVACITVASRQSYDAAVAAGAPPDRLRIIPNGVNLTTFSQDQAAADRVRERLGLGRHPVIAAAGNLTGTKAFDRLVDAFGAVLGNPAFAAWKLVIAGEGPERSKLEGLIASRGLGGSVLLPGRLAGPDVGGLLSAASLLVHPSLSEGFGNIVLEAMASGCPVLATATGAARDLITDKLNGRLVEAGDTDALRVALGEMLADGDSRVRYAVAAAAGVRDRFTIQARAAAFAHLYESLAA